MAYTVRGHGPPPKHTRIQPFMLGGTKLPVSGHWGEGRSEGAQYGVWRALYAPLAGSGAEVFVHSRGATHGLCWNLLEPSSWPPCRTPEIRLWLYDLYMPPRRRPKQHTIPYVSGKQTYKSTVMSLTIKAACSCVTLIRLLNKAFSHDVQLVISFYYNLSSR